MSARQSPVERDARTYATTWLLVERGRREDRKAFELLDATADSLACRAARAVLRGDMPEARRYATAYQLVADSRDRLAARKSRERHARNAAEAAAHGIAAGDVVRGVSRTGRLPVGTECTIDDVSGNLLWATIDGERHVVWAEDVERVPIPESGIEDVQVGDDVLTPSRGPGVVEHVDVVSGVTVRVHGETWRYWPGQLTRYSPAAVGDKLVVRGIGAQATVLGREDVGYSVRYDDAPDVLLCPFSAVVQVLPQAVAA
ncbi:hypothetical protein [Promicromonospora sp. NPDC023805]|uniref:hypothetical protein n=1 Tax=Promicromonospora sp. NPDC023805 TaxID=3154696 RepID=UPI00340A8564